MKKLLVLALSVLMLCSLFAVNASAAVITCDAEYYVEVEYDADGFIFMTYEFPEKPEIPAGIYDTDLLWVDIWVFEAGSEPASGEALAEMFMLGQSSPVYGNKLMKTPNDDQFLATERWIGPSFDEGADSEFVFENGKTYHFYFGCCDGATWYYYTTPYVLEYEGESGAAPSDPTEAPVDPTEAPVDPTEAPADPTEAPADPTEAPVATEAPVDPTEEAGDVATEQATQEVSDPTQEATESTSNNNGDNTIIVIVVAAAVVIAAAIVVIILAKKKKAE